MGLVEDFVALMGSAYNNPAVFLTLTFGFAVLVAIVLPIPIEVVLLVPIVEQRWGYLLEIALAMALGKTVGAWLIFYLGVRVEGIIHRWSKKYRFAARFVAACERFVRKTSYVGLYLLLSIPLMSDTIPIYIYSLFNEEGKALDQRWFLLANFLAAWTRTGILVGLYLVGLDLLQR